MGDQDTDEALGDSKLRDYTAALLRDVQAMERMLEDEDLWETGHRSIGAEQEMFLVDAHGRPANVAHELLAGVSDPRIVPELGRFNLEANVSPQKFGGSCLSALEKEITEVVAKAREAAQRHGADVLLAGILPTLRKGDLSLASMMPMPRYRALNDALARLRGDPFHVVIRGIDELEASHDNVMMEACNTSFQVHFQVTPKEFARLYNISQVVTAPVLAAAVNSPVFLGRRLWQETRVALFQRSVDERSSAHHERKSPSRVSFGDGWVRKSVLEIYREQVARFRIVLSSELGEDPLEVLEEGGIPALSALRLHGGTVYRWNRACYGPGPEKAHLRIENRVLPSGPTVVDEVANAAFYFGLMSALPEQHEDITQVIDFDDAKDNFFKAARHGLDAQLVWLGGTRMGARELILERLLPQARAGLERAKIDRADMDRYLGIIEARVESGRTGSRWVLHSLSRMGDKASADSRSRALVESMRENQRLGVPVHVWPLTHTTNKHDLRKNFLTVGQFMQTDLFTVRPEDHVDLAASVMDWERVRHIPVEDAQGRLRGLISHRMLVRLLTRRNLLDKPVAVSELMVPDPLTVTPDTPTLHAMRLMRDKQVGCLPVVEGDNKLVGMIGERDLIDLSAALLEKYLQDEGDRQNEEDEEEP